MLCPTYIGLAELDQMVPPTLKQDLEQWAKLSSGNITGQTKPAVTFSVYPGMDHGFAARPDTTDPAIAVQYARAFEDTIDFFQSMKKGK